MQTATVSREIHLAAPPHGIPGPDSFSWAELRVPDPGPGEVVIANTHLSVDPCMPGRMDEGPSSVPHWPIGAPLDGATVGVLVASEAPELPVGSAGSPEKVAYLRDELGFDAAFDDDDRPVAADAPDGIDVFFDNVGGEHREAAIGAINPHGRLAFCGAISGHNDVEPAPGPRNKLDLIVRRVRAEGFLVLDDLDRPAAFRAEAARWLRDGDVIARETVVEGLEAMPDAFLGLYRSDNIGKMVVRVGDAR